MKAIKIIWAMVSVFLTLPISMYLQFKTLKMIEATELMMFLFWVYVPLVLFSVVISKLIEIKGKE